MREGIIRVRVGERLKEYGEESLPAQERRQQGKRGIEDGKERE